MAKISAQPWKKLARIYLPYLLFFASLKMYTEMDDRDPGEEAMLCTGSDDEVAV